MTRSLRIVGALCCAFAVVLALAGCGSVDKGKYAGGWKLIYGSAENMSAEVIETMEPLGFTTTLHLNEDGTGTIDVFGESSDVTWSASSNSEGSITIVDMGTGTLKLANSELSIVNSQGESMTFTRNG